MPVSTSPDNQAIEYRYFVHDLMSNALLAEIPFRSVSYSRSLTEAGTFTGDIAVIDDTYNLSLYENTLPAKTALYVVRNGVCVWGGIIWARNYSLIDKVLSVSAAEFTSYLSHRVVWKTWNGTYEATAEVASGTMTLTLTTGQYGFTVGEAVYVSWISDYALYNGYFEVESVALTGDNRSIITVPATYFDAATGNPKTIPTLSIGPENPVSVETRQDNYQYAQDLLRELNTDLFDFDFANDEIRPGIDLFNLVTTISRTSNVATVTTSRKHELVPGQKVKVADIQPDSSFNNIEAIVSTVEDNYSFTYSNTGSDVAATAQIPDPAPIYSFKRSANVSTFETTADHPYEKGDILYIQNVSQTFDGYATVYGTPASLTEFQVVQIGPNIGKSYTDSASTPTATRGGSVSYGTFGEFSTLGDIGFDLTQNADFSSNLEANPIIRGFELKTVADVFEEYSTKPNGFEYRVDCDYTAAGGFKKYFKFLPLVPATLTAWLAEQETGFSGSIPSSAYGANELVFEYPGNVLEAQFEENADDSATRFFVQGKDSRLSSDASQPYSAASNHKLLRQGWPILDAVDDLDSPDEIVLYKQASRLLEESVPPMSTFTVSVNGSANPKLGTYNPGDWCSVKLNDDFVALRAASYLEQDYGLDNGVLVRKILSYTVNIPDTPSYPEEVELELVTEPAIPISGVTIKDGKVFNGY
jgi:hypothetical protein